jgi:hypothetical protein
VLLHHSAPSACRPRELTQTRPSSVSVKPSRCRGSLLLLFCAAYVCARRVRPRPVEERRHHRLRLHRQHRPGQDLLVRADGGRPAHRRRRLLRTGSARCSSRRCPGSSRPWRRASLRPAARPDARPHWYAAYSLARSDSAQPLPFAFGGEALPADYARAIADGALLAVIASLGLLQLGHETTPDLAQLAAVSLYLYGLAASGRRPSRAASPRCLALPALAASGAPSIALAAGRRRHRGDAGGAPARLGLARSRSSPPARPWR